MAENQAGGLSEAEQAYFDSEGETSFETAETETTTTTEAAPAETVGQEPEQEPEAQTEAEAAEAEGKGERDEKGRFVNYGALHAERAKRQQLEGEVTSLKQFKAVMEDRWRMVETAAQQQEPEKGPPDPNEDIFAYSKWQAEQLQKLEAKVNERETAETQSREAQEYEQKVWEHWNQSAAQYKTENADFDNAVKWMSETRVKQLQALAPLNPRLQSDAGITQQINTELKEIVVAAAQAQISPAQYIYDMAKSWGYTVAPADPGKIELPGKLKGIEQAQQGSRTVGQASGARAGADEISIDSLAAMPQNEFNEWMKVPANETRFKRMMGG
jgi:myosin heavy subunit